MVKLLAAAAGAAFGGWGIINYSRYRDAVRKGTTGLALSDQFLTQSGSTLVATERTFTKADRKVTIVPVIPTASRSFYDSLIDRAQYSKAALLYAVPIPLVSDVRDIVPEDREEALHLASKPKLSDAKGKGTPGIYTLAVRNGAFRSATGSDYFHKKASASVPHCALAVEVDAGQFRAPQVGQLAHELANKLSEATPVLLSKTQHLIVAAPDGKSAEEIANTLSAIGFRDGGESKTYNALHIPMGLGPKFRQSK